MDDRQGLSPHWRSPNEKAVSQPQNGNYTASRVFLAIAAATVEFRAVQGKERPALIAVMVRLEGAFLGNADIFRLFVAKGR